MAKDGGSKDSILTRVPAPELTKVRVEEYTPHNAPATTKQCMMMRFSTCGLRHDIVGWMDNARDQMTT